MTKNKMNKFFISLALLTIPILGVIAQQDAQYTQYMYNTQVINPAYSGSRGVFSIAALYRAQWTGLDGAPTTQTLTLNSPVSERVGIGLSIVNDEIGNGTNQNTYFNADFAYSIPTSHTGKLSFGLKAGGHMLNVDLSKLRNYNPGFMASDGSGIDRRFSPNFGAGIYYHTDGFYTGISVPNFLQTTHFDSGGATSSYLVKEDLEYYLISGFVTDINYNLKLKPALLLKAVKGAPMQLDISTTLLFNEQFSIGAAYRWDSALSALIGYQVNDKFMLGMAYDKETSNLGGIRYNDGSFEFFLRFELISRHRRVLTPRFF